MGKVFWTDEAANALSELDSRTQLAIRSKVSALRNFPHMYQVSEEKLFHGCHRFLVRPHYVVYYRVWGQDLDCYVISIRDARASQ